VAKKATRVWMIGRVHKDLTECDPIATEGYFNAFEDGINVFNVDALQDSLRSMVALSWDPNKDVLLMAGSMVGCAIALHMVLQIHGECEILIYNAKSNKYLRRTVNR
jgi:hypothetical protein